MKKGFEDLTKEWLAKAKSDLLYARASFQDFDDFYSQMCILCHDAAEKYLKALLISRGVRPDRTHDLVALLRECALPPGDKALGVRLDEPCRALNRYYVPLKYPSHFPPLTRDQAGEAIGAADEVERAILSSLGEVEA